ncbi:FAD-dependent oxidoreductase [Frateuria sp. GZRe12]|uniref:FAD-dependent oxidoreductase n=1 Tax=Frateuria sp. GZRe12 TaxID=3351533 RepID=UPI003EDC6AFF
MKRRELLKAALALPLLPALMRNAQAMPAALAGAVRARLRPGQPGWPAPAEWEALKRAVGGRLLKPVSPFAGGPGTAAYVEAVEQLKNPFALGDDPALTQTSGWADAWTSRPSAYAVAAESAADVAAAVTFARQHRLRLVVKGGGHSYQGTSEAPDSLLVWPRRMNKVTLHEGFVPSGGEGKVTPLPAVSVGAGAMWIDVYHAVTTLGGRYVQGGGCTTVGVAGLVQSGGFGSFSKGFGTAASNLLEAEVVTADGAVLTVSEHAHPELFWGLKGGGGGSLGAVTRLTLRTFELPPFFGAVFGTIQASSDQAYRALVARAMAFYREALFNRHWGEQMTFAPDNTLSINMVFQGLTQAQAEQAWKPFFDWVRAHDEYSFAEAPRTLALPAQHFWDADFFRQHAPQLMVNDDRPGAPSYHMVWTGDRGQVGWFIHAYQSAWMPAALLAPGLQSALADALFAASRRHDFALHFNKGMAGGEPSAIARTRDTAMNPQVADAFALAICADGSGPAFPGLREADLAQARGDAAAVAGAMDALRLVAPHAGSYVSESDYFLRDWQRGFWGSNYARLLRAKRRYDPDGLFVVHHGVGSEGWSADGFTRVD